MSYLSTLLAANTGLFLTSTTYTATANQTSFNAVYNPPYIQVYQNGLKLASADYTATSGTAVVLDTGASLNDNIELVSYKQQRIQQSGISDSSVSTAITINSSNRVGVGTSNPEGILSVDGTGSGTVGKLQVGPNYNGGVAYNTGDQIVQIFNWTGNSRIQIAQHGVGGYQISNSGQNLLFSAAYDGSGGEKMRIDSSGRVGIGRTPTTNLLEVAGTIESTTGGFKFPDGSTQTKSAGHGLSAMIALGMI